MKNNLHLIFKFKSTLAGVVLSAFVFNTPAAKAELSAEALANPVGRIGIFKPELFNPNI